MFDIAFAATSQLTFIITSSIATIAAIIAIVAIVATVT